MTTLIPIALIGWIPIVLIAFSVMRPRRALLVCVLGGWMFLPSMPVSVGAFPDLTKGISIAVAGLVGVLAFCPERLLGLRPRLIDLPVVVWCLCPIASSLQNDLGLYDGLSASFSQCVEWGIPYLLGRAMFNDLAGLRELAVGIVVAAIVYSPLCIWEMRMSPQLHTYVYGVNPVIDFRANALHLGISWFRPNVFMLHGLNVAMFFATAATAATWLWQTRSMKRLLGMPMGFVSGGLALMLLMCQVFGALGAYVLGVLVLVGIRVLRSPLPVACLIALAPTYMLARAGGSWSGDAILTAVSAVSEERADSLAYRMHNEDLLSAKAMERPLFGWGRWGRSRVYDDWGKDISTTDGLWIIAFGESGLVGLCSLVAAVLLPLAILWHRQPARSWLHPAFAPVAALAVIVGLFMIYNVMNAIATPLYPVAIGGLAHFAVTARAPRHVRSRRTVAGRPHPRSREILA